MTPAIHQTEIPCPKCGGYLIQTDSKGSVYGCKGCGGTFYLIAGKWYDWQRRPLDEAEDE